MFATGREKCLQKEEENKEEKIRKRKIRYDGNEKAAAVKMQPLFI